MPNRHPLFLCCMLRAKTMIRISSLMDLEDSLGIRVGCVVFLPCLYGRSPPDAGDRRLPVADDAFRSAKHFSQIVQKVVNNLLQCVWE